MSWFLSWYANPSPDLYRRQSRHSVSSPGGMGLPFGADPGASRHTHTPLAAWSVGDMKRIIDGHRVPAPLPEVAVSANDAAHPRPWSAWDFRPVPVFDFDNSTAGIASLRTVKENLNQQQ